VSRALRKCAQTQILALWPFDVAATLFVCSGLELVAAMRLLQPENSPQSRAAACGVSSSTEPRKKL
jgi:hypothetical protein